VFFERVADLFLVVHDFLLLIFDQDALVHAQDEGGGVELEVVVEFGEGVFGREGVSLVLRAELHLDVVFGGVVLVRLQHEYVVLAFEFAPPLPLPLLGVHFYTFNLLIQKLALNILNFMDLNNHPPHPPIPQSPPCLPKTNPT